MAAMAAKPITQKGELMYSGTFLWNECWVSVEGDKIDVFSSESSSSPSFTIVS